MITSFIPVFEERLSKLKNTLKNELERAKSDRRKDVMKRLVKDAKVNYNGQNLNVERM